MRRIQQRTVDAASRRVRKRRAAVSLATAFFPALALGGCVLAPRAMKSEQQRLADAGRPWERPAPERRLPEVAAQADWRELLQHAFLANGDLERAYFDWKRAVERVDLAAGYPNTNVSLGFEYLFSGGNLKSWDRTTLSVGFDPMQNLSLPPKVLAAGKVAFAEARAAGRRFAAAKFELQEQVLQRYWDYALLGERIRLQEAHVGLLDVAAATAGSRVQAGERQDEVLRAEIERRLGENALQNLRAELPQESARLNTLVGRRPDAPLDPPEVLPPPRSLPVAEAALVEMAVADNPELAALRAEVEAREQGERLARLQFLPDINPFAGLTGSAEQFVGAAITLATTIPQIRAAVREARSAVFGSLAMTRQADLDRAAEFAAALAARRNAERQAEFLSDSVLPIADLAAGNARQAYATGGAGLMGWIDAERAVLDVRLGIAEARAAREQQLATLEALAGIDVETLETGVVSAEAGRAACADQ